MVNRSTSQPWFFRRWFLQLAFVMFWPTWGILIFRSPWHNSLRWKVVAWLHFIVSAWFWLMAIEGLTQSLIFLVPGLAVVVVSGFQWDQVRAALKASGAQVGKGAGAATRNG